VPRRRNPIAEEYFRLLDEFHRDPGSPEVRSRWLELWRETLEGEKLRTADLLDAALILHLGFDLAMEDRNYRAGADLLYPYFDHPGIERADEADWVEIRCALGLCLLCVGEELEALGVYRSVLIRDRRGRRWSGVAVARNSLLAFCEQRVDTEMASEALTDLGREIVHRLERQRSVHKSIPGCLTYAQLCDLLESTFPPTLRDRLRERRGLKAENQRELPGEA
jgi:hypothetical protein